jgi:hypothetical protein
MLQILDSTRIHVPESDRPAFEALRLGLLRDIQPLNAIQTQLANSALRAAWTIHRCDSAELALAQESGLDPLLSADRRLDRIQRTRTQAERDYRLALKELKRVQTDCAIRGLKENEGLQAMPVLIDTKAYIVAARAAAGIAPKERICFPPDQAALDQAFRASGAGDTAWEVWARDLGHHPHATPAT